ncbi:Peptidoglycan-associated lipoprotein [Dyadobacter sp. CECT 9623]|uniref:Peptidoglycan-associated lipoprotein n=1 Tax=Dyadobacter linearis TaxID=2823330 RepID=A0ABN7RD46_9BACT|nr:MULTISPECIES: OmpA family protein [unclassified Dyadobacter]MCE7063519.1 OmpA family protein [Dyadobacter sp. CY343]CAG5073228.1 Peptidoglycan-associated lipoprotein [Dyadobacter sp. CECT 9623]
MKKVSQLICSFALGAMMALPSLAQPLEQPNSPDYNPKATYDGPYKLNTWSISAHFGPSMFFGDLREYDFWPVTKTTADSHKESGTIQGGLTLNKQLSYWFGSRLDVSLGNLRGMKRRNYNRYFEGNYFDVSVAGTVNLKGLLMGPNKMKRWKVDAYVGVGQIFYNADAYDLTGGVKLRETGSMNDWIVPTGLNVNYEVTKRIDIGLDFRLTHTNSDYLDATFGGDYDRTANSFVIADQKTSRKGNSELDSYGYGAVQVTYKLGKNPLKVQKVDGKWDYKPDEGGYYHLRYTDPKALIKPPKILTLEEMDSVAKANRPKDIDPRLLLDTDGDGVSDFFDKEPNSPAGSIVDGGGRVLDFDAYVKNALKNGAACAEIFANVMFDTDKNTIKPEAQEMLKNVAKLMNLNGCRLQLAGHTDRRASDRYNIALSRRRVDAVKNYLINEAGLTDPSKVIVDYFGSFKPIADSARREGLQRNRRVELKLLP